MRVTFRPLPAWPYPESKKRPATYRSDYDATLSMLEYEIDRLRGSEVIIGVVATSSDVRLDGMLRADAKVLHPGVELSFEVPGARTTGGTGATARLTFHTDVHSAWKANLRAIALGLESLRAVSRYGITSGIGEQYAGFAMLPPGGPDPDRGRRLVEAAGSVKEALRRHHPDQGGQDADFVDVQAYREQVGA